MEATTQKDQNHGKVAVGSDLFDKFKLTSLEDFKFMKQRPVKDGKLEDCASNQFFMKQLR